MKPPMPVRKILTVRKILAVRKKVKKKLFEFKKKLQVPEQVAYETLFGSHGNFGCQEFFFKFFNSMDLGLVIIFKELKNKLKIFL